MFLGYFISKASDLDSGSGASSSISNYLDSQYCLPELASTGFASLVRTMTRCHEPCVLTSQQVAMASSALRHLNNLHCTVWLFLALTRSVQGLLSYFSMVVSFFSWLAFDSQGSPFSLAISFLQLSYTGR